MKELKKNKYNMGEKLYWLEGSLLYTGYVGAINAEHKDGDITELYGFKYKMRVIDNNYEYFSVSEMRLYTAKKELLDDLSENTYGEPKEHYKYTPKPEWMD